MINLHSSYDQQARAFDRRAGLPPLACEAIVSKIKEISGEKANDTILEIGCGTGQLGRLLAKNYRHYVGLDLSLPMLSQFKAHNQQRNVLLIQSDGNKFWPVAKHQTKIIFSSRALHWLNVAHTVREAFRVTTQDRAIFLIGRVERPAGSWETLLRQQCHQLLKQSQFLPRDSELHLKLLSSEFCREGALPMPSEVVYKWQVNRQIQQAFIDWKSKPGLAGLDLSIKQKSEILAQLKHWVHQHWGAALPTQAERHYVLYAFNILGQ